MQTLETHTVTDDASKKEKIIARARITIIIIIIRVEKTIEQFHLNFMQRRMKKTNKKSIGCIVLGVV